MLGEMREPAYARLNARHETPVLITDDGRALSENMAIAAWLEARDTERRISFDPMSPEADRMHQLMAFVNTGFTSAFTPLWAALELEPTDPTMQESLRRWGRDLVCKRHDQIEAMIGETPFFLGQKPTLADGLLIGVARWLDYHQVADRSRWSRLSDVRQRLEADPAVQFATAVEAGQTPEGTGACRGHLALAEVIARFGE